MKISGMSHALIKNPVLCYPDLIPENDRQKCKIVRKEPRQAVGAPI